MQSLKVNFPEFNNAKGYWVATTGGNGNAELTLDEGTSNSQSYTLNRTVTNAISSTISGGFSFFSASVSNNCSVETSRSMTKQFNTTVSKTCTAISPAADYSNPDTLWTLYQWVTEVDEE